MRGKPNTTCGEGICLHCHRLFVKTRAFQRLCSRLCYSRRWHGARKSDPPPVICAKCGKEVKGKYGKRFCSQRCRDAARSPVIVNGRGKGGSTRGLMLSPRQVCQQCGTLFYAEPKRLRRGQGKYCSVRCRHTAMRPEDYPQHDGRRGKGGRRADLGNIYFRSRWEANWARYLNWLKSIGEIQLWKFEPKTFTFTKISHGSRFYTPDFLVINKDGSAEYHEVKGWMDQKSATKIRRMAKYFPEVKLIVIDAKAYRAVAKKVAALCPGWESNSNTLDQLASAQALADPQAVLWARMR